MCPKKLGEIQEWLDYNSKSRIQVTGRMGSGKTTFIIRKTQREGLQEWRAKFTIKTDEFTFRMKIWKLCLNVSSSYIWMKDLVNSNIYEHGPEEWSGY